MQTPTLCLVVDRDREIAHLVLVPFWSLDMLLPPTAKPSRPNGDLPATSSMTRGAAWTSAMPR